MLDHDQSREIVLPPPTEAIPPIRRENLNSLHEKLSARRMTLVHAPAGFGKTTLLLEWRRLLRESRMPVVWISPRAGVRRAEDLAYALSDGCAAWANSPRDRSRDLVKLLIETACRTRGGRIFVMVDDAHLLEEGARELLMDCVARARDHLSLVVAARGANLFPVARLRSIGKMMTVDAEMLRFSTREGMAFLANAIGAPIDLAIGSTNIDRFEGWVGGLSTVASGAVTGSGLPSLEEWPRAIEHFFEEEVFCGLSPSLDGFLQDISIPDVIDADVCRALTGNPASGELLEKAVDDDLFVFPVKGEFGRYRLHPFFRKVLQRRLARVDTGALARMQKSAALFYCESGVPLAAVEHASRSDDPCFLAEMLNRHGEGLIYASHMDLVVDLALSLPEPVLAEYPMLILAIAWRATRRLELSSASERIETADRLIARREEADPMNSDTRSARQLLRHRRIVLAMARQEMSYVERESDALLREIGDGNAYLSCNLLAMKIAACRDLYHFQDTMRLEADARQILGKPGTDFASISFKASIAPNLSARGEVATAERFLTEAMTTAERFGGAKSAVCAIAALPLAELRYDGGDLDGARMLIDDYLSDIRIWGLADQILSGHLVKARLSTADGRFDEALRVLHEAHLVALECGLDYMLAAIVAERVRCLILNGQAAKAQQLFNDARLAPGDTPIPTRDACHRDEMIALAWLRLELQKCCFSKTRKVARMWRDFLLRHGALKSAVTFELLLAQVAFLDDEEVEARRLMRNSISLAAPAGWTRMFIDEGEIVGTLIRRSYEDRMPVRGAVDDFGLRLLAAVAPATVSTLDEEPAVPEKLAQREIEILSLVDNGLRNREIGARLGLTEGTVKWYLQQIYDKLGIRRRSQAAWRAKQLGMLS